MERGGAPIAAATLERRLLQASVVLAGVVPVAGGLWGVLGHLSANGAAAQSQSRYLSGLLLGIGLCFWVMIPGIERRGPAFRVLVAVVITGGLARLAGAAVTGFGPSTSLPLIMELGVTPLLALWRERVERGLRA